MVALVLAALASSCANPTPPPQRELLHLHGTAYERGLQHGQKLKPKIRAFYTTLLTSSLLPYLNREQPGIASFLKAYDGPDYADGKFSYQLLLDSALAMEDHIPAEYQQEMHGIADGAEMSYEQILVLNTFADTTLAVRAVALALQLSDAPVLQRVELVGAADDDVDNDGDGAIDQADEGVLDPYIASPVASAVELQPDTKFRFVLTDPDGVDPATVRLSLDERVFTQADAALQMTEVDATHLAVLFTPPEPLPPARAMSITLAAGDTTLVTDPPPSHPRLMREERITFTTRGYGKAPHEVPNRGIDDGRTRPTSIAFAATGSATADGKPLLAQHFTLLDANTAHNQTAVFVHHPDKGEPFVVVGWAGIVWGFSGMNASGQTYACQPSDTVDNAVVSHLIASIGNLATGKLIADGAPIGIVGRRLLKETQSTSEAIELLHGIKSAYGWNCLLADASGSLRAAELDTNLDGQWVGGVADYGTDPTDPANLDAFGQPWASLGRDDLRTTGHYLRNAGDLPPLTVQGKRALPQPRWASTYFRSLRSFAALGDALRPMLGKLDAAGAEQILARDELVDHSDSMNAVVYEPASRTVHSAIGTEPATDSPFETVDLRAEAP